MRKGEEEKTGNISLRTLDNALFDHCLALRLRGYSVITGN